MYDTKHVQKRSQQRGITKDMINFTLDHGVIQGDRWFLNRKLLNEKIEALNLKAIEPTNDLEKLQQYLTEYSFNLKKHFYG